MLWPLPLVGAASRGAYYIKARRCFTCFVRFTMSHKNEIKFCSNWWSVHLPTKWQTKEDKECVTLLGDHFQSALQISSARKESSVVTDEDIKDFANGRISDTVTFHRVDFGFFCGFYSERIEAGIFWREWWLRSEKLLIFASYNVDEQFKASETAIVDGIIKSLRPL